MELDLQQINNIDLLELGDIIIEQEFRQYFISNGGQEHYKLLAYFSTLFENETLSKSYRLRPDEFRLVKSISDYCIFLEVNNGPFEDKDTIWK